MTRAERRHRFFVKRKKVEQYARQWLGNLWWSWHKDPGLHLSKIEIEKLHEEDVNVRTRSLEKNPKVCSCYGCGNERKYFNEPTMQEKKFADRMKHEIQDLHPDDIWELERFWDLI